MKKPMDEAIQQASSAMEQLQAVQFFVGGFDLLPTGYTIPCLFRYNPTP